MSAAPAETLLKAIQLSVSPVFLLAGIGAMMNVLSGRLGRSVDRARELKRRCHELDGGEQAEFRLIRQRIQLVVRAIALLTLSILLISAVVAVIFLAVALQINLSVVVAPLFVAAMLMLTSAAFCFLREITLASRQLQATFGPSESFSWKPDRSR